MSRYICLAAASLAITMTLVFSGCCSRNSGSGYGCGGCGWLDQFMQEQVECMQEKVWARRAFHLRFGHCERVHADHFRDGFIAGYSNVCDGKGGDIPTLPPEKYWGFNYRNQEGAAMQNACFAGWEAGADSARTDGSGSYTGIQIPRQVQEAIMEAEALEDQYGGISRSDILEITPAIEGETQSSVLQTIPQAIPQTNQPFTQDSGSILKSKARARIPARETSYGSDIPTPLPAVPIIPGPGR